MKYEKEEDEGVLDSSDDKLGFSDTDPFISPWIIDKDVRSILPKLGAHIGLKHHN